jgi:hypothetical protein
MTNLMESSWKTFQSCGAQATQPLHDHCVAPLSLTTYLKGDVHASRLTRAVAAAGSGSDAGGF